jgi:triosephosphate isomerase
MKREFIIAGNWKMNKTVVESIDFVKELNNKIEVNDRVRVLIFPPFTSIYSIRNLSDKIKIGSQNLFYEEKGAYTGEISPLMLKDLVDYVLIGHSERRGIFKELDSDINKKIKTALKYKFNPVLCIGETLEQRKGGKTFERIKKQVDEDLKGLKEQEIKSIIIAYEPIWAIGTGETATPAQAQEVHGFIRELLNEKVENPEDIFILYGGSVKPENSFDLLSQKDINGFLIGGASLKVDSFSAIIETSCKIAK